MEEKSLIEAFEKAGAPVVSDAMGRAEPLPGIRPVDPEQRPIAGPALTVKVPPGDWLLAIKAIDAAREGQVIVIDAGGPGPVRKAVWGELASHAAVVRGVKAVVIHGYIRDVDGIRELGFPAFASDTTPSAGDPEGKGEVGVVLDIGGVRVSPGDIVVGDANGVVVVPRGDAERVAAKALEIHELEARVRRHIVDKKTTLYQALVELGVLGKVR